MNARTWKNGSSLVRSSVTIIFKYVLQITDDCTYVGTAQCPSTDLVWHVYDGGEK